MNSSIVETALKNLRAERRTKFGITSTIISLDGMKGTGKTRAREVVDSLRHHYIRINDFRETSLVKSNERMTYLENVVRERLVEDPNITASFYTADRIQAWDRHIIPSAQELGIIILDRSVYTTAVHHMLAEKIQPNKISQERLLEILNILLPEPIIPPDLAIFTSCQVNIAYERIKEREKERRDSNLGSVNSTSSKDPISEYPAYAYKRENLRDGIPEEVTRWYLTRTDQLYRTLAGMVPNGTIVLTGKKSNGINKQIPRLIRTAYNRVRKYK